MPKKYSRPIDLLAWSILFVVAVSAISIAFIESRASAHARECQANLRAIDEKKLQWALMLNRNLGDRPTWADLTTPAKTMRPPQNGYFLPEKTKFPTCPEGGVYSINPIGAPPTCSRASCGHVLQNN